MDTIKAFFLALKGETLRNLLGALLFLLVGWILIKYLVKLVSRLMSRRNDLDASIQSMVCTILRGALLFLLLLCCADQLGLPTTSIITLVGTFGLAFSLALQSSLSNLAGGIFILTSKPFVTGDFITAGDVSGTVTKIGFIHTLLNTMDNRQIYVPNGTISGASIINFSRETRRQIELTIPVPYECSLQDAKSVIEAAVAKETRIEEDPFIRTWNLSASSVDILIRVWCPAPLYWEVRSALLEEIKNDLDSAGIAIPYNQLDVHVRQL